MCTCKGKDKKPANKQWKENVQRVYEREIKQVSMIYMASIETGMRANKQEGKQARKLTNKQKVNKQDSKQKGVSARDKCRFRSSVRSFILLKYGQHTSNQDSCINM